MTVAPHVSDRAGTLEVAVLPCRLERPLPWSYLCPASFLAPPVRRVPLCVSWSARGDRACCPKHLMSLAEPLAWLDRLAAGVQTKDRLYCTMSEGVDWK